MFLCPSVGEDAARREQPADARHVAASARQGENRAVAPRLVLVRLCHLSAAYGHKGRVRAWRSLSAGYCLLAGTDTRRVHSFLPVYLSGNLDGVLI